MAEYIEREAVLMYAKMFVHIAYNRSNPLRDEEIEKAVNEIPAADVVPVRHGRWMDCKPYNPEFNGYECSECGAKYQGFSPDNYCPNCGAHMVDSEDTTEQTYAVEPIYFDEEIIHTNCTVQVWRNSETGEESWGWWENREEDDESWDE